MAAGREENLLLEIKVYYENCPGCRQDRVKDDKPGIPFRAFFFVWGVQLCTGKSLLMFHSSACDEIDCIGHVWVEPKPFGLLLYSIYFLKFFSGGIFGQEVNGGGIFRQQVNGIHCHQKEMQMGRILVHI